MWTFLVRAFFLRLFDRIGSSWRQREGYGYGDCGEATVKELFFRVSYHGMTAEFVAKCCYNFTGERVFLQ